jgi:hypothetical protein
MAAEHLYEEYFLVCKNEDCRHTIPLPSSFPEVVWQARAALHGGIPNENVVCPKCDRVYEYTRQNFQSRQSRKLAPYEQEELTVATVNFPCETCRKFQVQVHRPIPVGTIVEQVATMMKGWKFVDAECPKGDLVSRIGPGYGIATFFHTTKKRDG